MNRKKVNLSNICPICGGPKVVPMWKMCNECTKAAPRKRYERIKRERKQAVTN